MSLALLFHYLMLNMFRMLIHPSSEGCDLFVELFRVSVRVWVWVRVCALRDSHKHCFAVDRYLLGHSGEDHVGFL